VEATVISDYLILQTSSGDQSVLYFDKKSNTVQTQRDYSHVTVTLDEGWYNNPNSAANWTPGQINLGSYNGNFANVANKYQGNGGNRRVATIFDNDPAQTVTRTPRPTVPLHVAKYDIGIRDTNPNGEYLTGTARAFWRVVLNHNPGNRPQPYHTAAQSMFGGAAGHVMTANYSRNHTKINDILIHNPISVEYAMLLPLHPSRDQRVVSDRGLAVQLAQKESHACPGNPADCEFRFLNCRYVGTSHHTEHCYTPVTERTPNVHDHTVGCIDTAKITEAFQPIWTHCPGRNCRLNPGGTSYCSAGCALICAYDRQWWPCSFNDHLCVIEWGCIGHTNPSWRDCPGNCTHGGLRGETWGLVNLHEIVSGANYVVTNSWIVKQPKNAPIFRCGGLPFTRHVCDPSCSHTPVLRCTEPHHRGEHYDVSNPVCWSACGDDSKHAAKQTAPPNSAAAGLNMGHFINLDWGFQIYFPNTGSFYQGEPHGLSAVTAQRGKGFVDGLDTTEWIASKRVRFMFDVIYCGPASQLNPNGSQHGNSADGSDSHKHTASCTLYRAGSWIDLTAHKEFSLYNFYAVGSNTEAAASRVTFESIAINAPGMQNDNPEPANRRRDGSLRAKHGAVKTTFIDVVGRIGNLVMEDTGDFRFSNFFKTPVSGNAPNDWLIQGIVKRVDMNGKNHVLSSLPDIRGLSTPFEQNTYGLLPWLNDGKNLPFPLSPDKNNIQALREQPISLGYPVYLDVSTLGKDYHTIEVIPHYYFFDLDTGQVSPLDVYMAVSATEYAAINRFGVVKAGWDQNAVHPFRYTLDWTRESGRRNVGTAEAMLTQSIVEASTRHFVDDDLTAESSLPMAAPAGNAYVLGTAQILSFGERARTFIGSDSTMGVNQNLGGVLPEIEFQKAAKRWHFTLGLPSSAVVIDAGAAFNDANAAKYRNANGVILMTAVIRASGDKFTLEYRHSENGTFSMGGNTYTLPDNIPNVIAVYSGSRSSKDDLAIRRTH
jgi:hypothetical protein